MDSEINLGQLEKLALKEIWPGEATHFTPWLAQNLDYLGKVLDMDLQLETVEAAAGDFSADIVARDLSTNRRIVIENQYGGTDHKHLGQLMTYCAVLGADVVVWIAETVRSEHKAAIDFLNQNLTESLSLYAIEAAAVRVDSSRPAFVLSVVSQPNAARQGSGAAVVQTSETAERYRGYFQALIDELREKHRFTNARTGQPQNWYSFASDNSRLYKFGTSFTAAGKVRSEVYIDSGDKALNESLFDLLHGKKEEIAKNLGMPLEWERLDTRRACRIATYRDGDIEADPETLASIRAWVIECLLAFKKVFPTFVAQAKLQLEQEAAARAGHKGLVNE